MSDEPYDADGDVGRFLHCPSPEAHMFPLSEPERTGVGLRHTTDHVQGQTLAAPQTLSNAAPDLSGRGQGLPAPPQTLTVAPDLGLQQAPVTGFHGHPALHQSLTTTVAPDFGVHALTTTEFQGHPALETTLNAAPDFGLPVPAPPIDAAAGNYQPSSAMLDVEYHQPMAIDNNDIQQPSHQMLPPEMHRRHAYGGGGFAEPTTMLCDGGADEASLVERNMQMLLADGGVIPHPHRPSPSLYEQLVNNGQAELAAVVRNLERGESSGAAAALINDVYPVKEDVWFRPIVRGQLDCSRCHSVREVVRQDGNYKEVCRCPTTPINFSRARLYIYIMPIYMNPCSLNSTHQFTPANDTHFVLRFLNTHLCREVEDAFHGACIGAGDGFPACDRRSHVHRRRWPFPYGPTAAP